MTFQGVKFRFRPGIPDAHHSIPGCSDNPLAVGRERGDRQVVFVTSQDADPGAT